MPLLRTMAASAALASTACVGTAANAPGVADPAKYYRLITELESLDVNDRDAISSVLKAKLQLTGRSHYIMFWSAEVPESATHPAMHIDYRERIPGRSPGADFLAISFRGEGPSFAEVADRYPGLKPAQGSGGHEPAEEWSYELPTGANRLQLEFRGSSVPLLKAVSLARRPR